MSDSARLEPTLRPTSPAGPLPSNVDPRLPCCLVHAVPWTAAGLPPVCESQVASQNGGQEEGGEVGWSGVPSPASTRSCPVRQRTCTHGDTHACPAPTQAGAHVRCCAGPAPLWPGRLGKGQKIRLEHSSPWPSIRAWNSVVQESHVSLGVSQGSGQAGRGGGQGRQGAGVGDSGGSGALSPRRRARFRRGLRLVPCPPTVCSTTFRAGGGARVEVQGDGRWARVAPSGPFRAAGSSQALRSCGRPPPSCCWGSSASGILRGTPTPMAEQSRWLYLGFSENY